METDNVCRLCGGNVELINLFRFDNDKTLEVLRHTVCAASGIAIKPDDIVSKMVCQRCCEIAIKLHKYRTNALVNDEVLKAQYGFTSARSNQEGHPQSSSSTNAHNNRVSNDPLEALNNSIKNEFANESNLFNQSTSNEMGQVLPFRSVPPAAVVVKEKFKHQSVKKLFKENHRIIIPEKIFTEDMLPVITLDKAEVTDWFAEQFEQVKQKLTNITLKKVTNSDDISDLKQAINSSSLILNNFLVTSKLAPVSSPSTMNLTQPDTTNTSSLTKSQADDPVITGGTTTSAKQSINKLLPKSKRKKSLSDEIQNTKISFNQNTSKFGTVSSMDTTTIDHVSDHGSRFSLQLKRSSDGYQITSQIKTKTKFHESSRIAKKEIVDSLPSTSKTEPSSIKVKSVVPTARKHTAQISHSKTRDKNIQKPNDIILPKLLLNSPTIIPPVPKARKRTAKRTSSHQSRRMEKNIEVVPKKKNRRYFNSDTVTDTKQLDSLVHANSSHVRHNEKSVTPAKTSEPDNLLVLTAGKSLEVFICTLCSVVCDTKKQLVDHEKTHLTCKFCKVKIKNVQLLEEHLNDTCVINVMKNISHVPLVRVDEEACMLNKYADAFKPPSDYAELPEPFNNDSDNDDNGNDMFMEHMEEDLSDTEVKDEDFSVEYHDLNLKNTIFDPESANNIRGIKSENLLDDMGDAVSISDDSGSEIEFTIVPRHTIVNASDVKGGEQSESSTSRRKRNPVVDLTANEIVTVSFQDLSKQYTSETAMIKGVFKKCYHAANKTEKCTQSFTARNKAIKRSVANMIVLHHMYSELLIYRVLVYFEAQSTICARFGAPKQKPKSLPLEYWGHKEPQNIKEHTNTLTTNKKVSGATNKKSSTTRTPSSSTKKNAPRKKLKKIKPKTTPVAILPATKPARIVGDVKIIPATKPARIVGDVKIIPATNTKIEAVYTVPTISDAAFASDIKCNLFNSETSPLDPLRVVSPIVSTSLFSAPCENSIPDTVASSSSKPVPATNVVQLATNPSLIQYSPTISNTEPVPTTNVVQLTTNPSLIQYSPSSTTELVPSTNVVQLTTNPSLIQYSPTTSNTEPVPTTNVVQLTTNSSLIPYSPMRSSTELVPATNVVQLTTNPSLMQYSPMSGNTELVPTTNIIQITRNPSLIQYSPTILSTTSTNSYQFLPTSTALNTQNNLIINNNITQLNQIVLVSNDLKHNPVQLQPMMNNILYRMQNTNLKSIEESVREQSVTNERNSLKIEEIRVEESINIDEVD